MRPTPADYESLQRLAKADLARAIDLGVSLARRERAQALRDAFRDAGLGLAQVFGLTHRPVPAPRRRAQPSRG